MEELQFRPPPQPVLDQLHNTESTETQGSELLFELGEEPLFSGRNSNAVASSSRITRPALVELTTSLDVARVAFCCALNRLLHQSFEESRVNSPVGTHGGPTLTPSDGIHSDPFLDLPTSSINGSKNRNPYPQLLSVPPNLLLPTLLASLRLGTQHEMTEIPAREIELLKNQDSEVIMEELQSRIARIAITLSPTDSALATALGSLLTCIERLQRISEHDASPISTQPIHSERNSDVYATLLLQAKELQSDRSQWSREGRDSVVGAAREVELAESECLWGRVDELSETVRVLCRTRADSYVVGEEGDTFNPFLDSNRIRTGSTTEGFQDRLSISDLPRYSTDYPRGTLPSYFDAETGSGIHSREKSVSSLEENALRSTRSRQSSGTVYNEKMQKDLESVSSAIERLYVVSPQLANQRVEPDRRKLRERQLANLGNAIERLSVGRLDNQRAVASPIPDEDPEERKQRMQRKEDLELDRLIGQIDRAASRTLADQRVDFNGKKKELNRSVSDETVRTGTPSMVDCSESDRQAHILDSVGKGRMSSQDASFSPSHTPTPLTNPQFINPFGTSSASTSVSSFFLSEDSPVYDKIRKTSLTSSDRLPTAMKKKFSIGLFKRSNSPGGTRRGSDDGGSPLAGAMSRSHSATFESTKPSIASLNIEYIAEESRNLGTITVTFWPTKPLLPPSTESYTVESIESVNLTIIDSTGRSFRILLPSPVIKNQEVKISLRGAHFEFKLQVIESGDFSSAENGFTDVQSPLSTTELRTFLPTSFSCVNCRKVLVKSESIIKYNSLPSEHWAEMLDSWMCHGDQELSEDLIKKGKGIRPREGEGLVAAAYIVFEIGCTQGWKGRNGDEGRRTDTDDLLTSAYCQECDSLIGYRVNSLSPDPTLPVYFRLLKYATFPTPIKTRTSKLGPADMLRSYSFATHITAELLQIGQAHACHRFVVEDVETEQARLLLWVFNPSLRISYSRPDGIGSDLTFHNTSIHASKIFYSIVEKESDSICQEFIESATFTTERISYPLNVTKKLRNILEYSNERYAAGNRLFGPSGGMHVGFLERC